MPSPHDCPNEPHVHEAPAVFVPYAWIVHVDHEPVAVCLRPAWADRIVELIGRHGFVDVPDHLPNDLVWGPPITDPIVDWGLPVDPTKAPR